jgi:phosphate transport system protein
MVQTAIDRAMTALLNRDALLARAVIDQDSQIDHAEVQIQEECVRILDTEHPSGTDLRLVVAVLKINDNLERVGDLAENVARVVADVAEWERFKTVTGCRELGAMAEAMLTRSLQALADRDTQLAQQVLTEDRYVDRMQEKIRLRIEHELDVRPEDASPLLRLEFVTRQLERVGDLATNIAEEVIYLVDGRVVRHNKQLIERLTGNHSEEMVRYRKIL